MHLSSTILSLSDESVSVILLAYNSQSLIKYIEHFSNKFLGHILTPIKRTGWMIDDKALIQPFATVLTGILIFLTIERSFKWQSSIEERMATYVDLAKKASQSVMNAYDVISELEVERTRIIERYKSEAQRAQRRDEINIRIKEQQLILAKSKKDYDTFTKAVESLTTKHEHHQTINKIQHGILIAMMSLISGSIILIIFLPQSLISSLMFSAGVVLLIVRVWMHYIE